MAESKVEAWDTIWRTIAVVQVKDGGRHGEKHSYSPSILKTEPTGFPDEFNVDYSERGGFSGSSAGKESACTAGDPGSIPGEGVGYPLQYFRALQWVRQ